MFLVLPISSVTQSCQRSLSSIVNPSNLAFFSCFMIYVMKEKTTCMLFKTRETDLIFLEARFPYVWLDCILLGVIKLKNILTKQNVDYLTLQSTLDKIESKTISRRICQHLLAENNGYSKKKIFIINRDVEVGIY